jgi:hypothetical protein
LERFKTIIGGFIKNIKNADIVSTVVPKYAITVFHGTHFPIANIGNNFTTYTFLSTTIDINIAKGYGSIVYVLHIPGDIPYIKLEAHNKHILLPIGCKFIAEFGIPSEKPAFIFCRCISTEIDVKNRLNSINTILSSKPQDLLVNELWDYSFENINIIKIQSINEIPNFQSARPISARPRSTRPRSTRPRRACPYSIYSSRNNNITGFSEFGFFKDLNDVTFFCKKPRCIRTTEYLRRRYINEIIALKVYQSFDIDTLQKEFTIYCDNYNNLWLASEYVKCTDVTSISYQNAIEYVQGYLVDCIMANWDINQKGNLKIRDNKLVRADMGGALAYRARGEFKLSFIDKREPTEHITMIPSSKLAECLTILGSNFLSILKSKIVANFHKISNLEASIPYLKIDDDILLNKILTSLANRVNYYVRNIDTVSQSVIHILENKMYGGRYDTLTVIAQQAGQQPTFLAAEYDVDEMLMFDSIGNDTQIKTNQQTLENLKIEKIEAFKKLTSAASGPRSSGGSCGCKGKQSRTKSAPASSARGRTVNRKK